MKRHHSSPVLAVAELLHSFLKRGFGPLAGRETENTNCKPTTDMTENTMNPIRKICLPLIIAGAFLCMAHSARAFIHPCIPGCTSQDLASINASLNQQPWKAGYAYLTNASTSQLSWPMEGPFGTVSRNPDLNLNYWSDDMSAVWNCSRMWYFTGNTNYAQKAHDILIAWANTQTNFGGQESGLALGDAVHGFVGGADILRGTWPGWTAADTVAVSNLFMNVYWPACSAGTYVPGEFNKGLLNLEAGIALALFCDDTNKFNQVIDTYRTYPAAGLFNLLPTGETGETGRDAGHVYGGMLGAAFISECAWIQGIDVYSDLDNRLLAVGEYYARNTLFFDNPFVPYGTVDYTYYADNAYYYTADRSALYLIQNAYKNRFHLPTPWIDQKLLQQNVDSENWMYAKTADFTSATPLTPIVRPAVSLASSGLTLTTLGTQTSGRSSSYANDVWTVSGLGNGVWTGTGGSDDCQFAYQAMTGDCTMVGQVTSCTYSGSQNGKCGLMIRDNLSATVSQRAWISITPVTTNLVECRQDGWTQTWGGSGWSTRSNPLPPGMPYWLKIERRDNLITTYSSQDGTSWAPIVSSYYGNLPSTVYIGMFICSGNTTVNTATLANVAFTGGSGGLVTTPAAPAAVFADGSSRAITVRWLPSFGATSYNLLRSTTSGSGYSTIASGLSTTTTSYVDTSVSAGTTYYYVVQAVNSAGTSGNSPQFYASSITSPMGNLAFSGTANDSANNPANAGNAFDQDPGSQWFYTGTNGWLQYDFGANNAQVIKRYTLNEAITISARDPRDWTFLGSQDGVNWTTLDTQNNQSFAYTYQLITYNISNTTAYRYYRINVTANNGDPTFLHIGELGLWSDGGRAIPDGRYHLVSRNSGKVADVSGDSAVSGTPLVQWTYNGGSSQQWDLNWQGNGQYSATNVGGAKVMDNGGTSTAGADLVIQPWNGGSSQLWKILPDSDGFYQIVSANSGMNVDVSGASTADGANIIQWTYNGNNNQQWMPSLASGSSLALPTPWNTGDIGAVGIAGGATYSASIYTVSGSGADTWGSSDQFRYVYQTAGTNCSITAEVLTITTNSSAAAKAGVMIRETLGTNSTMCEMQMTALNGAENLWRTTTGGNVTGTSTGGLHAPYWVRITRAGNTFTSYRSPDGVTWTAMSTNTIMMANSVYIGLYVCSHNNSALCTATFNNVVASP